MRILDWLYEMASVYPERLRANSFIPLLTDDGDEQGAILVHSDQTRDILIREFTFQHAADVAPHGGSISSYFADQLGVAAGIVNTAIQSGQMLQIVGSPQVLAGLKSGSLTVMHSAGLMTGTVVNNTTHKIVGQLRFAPANMAGIVGPLAIWQILNAVVAASHLQRIDAKLESLQRGIERLTIRHQAKTYGQLISAVATLQELSTQHAITGTFSPDMTVKLTLAERDIRSALAEQQFLVQRFENLIKDTKELRREDGAYKANQILKEEAQEFLIDAKLLVGASRASVLVSEAWIRHDLEHTPRHVSMRLRDLQQEITRISDTVDPLRKIEDLQEHAVNCFQEMNWFSRNIFNRGLKNEIQSRSFQRNSDREETGQNTTVPSVVIWKDQNNQTKSVIIDVAVEE